jgi:hypothetical protein
MHESSREEAMYSTRVVVDMIECLSHNSAVIRQKAEKLTEIGYYYYHYLLLLLYHCHYYN